MSLGFMEYEAKDNIIHRMDPRTKLFFMLFILVGSIILRDLFSLALLVLFGLCWWVLARIPISKLKTLVMAIMGLAVLFTVAQGFFYFRGKTPIFYFLGYPFYFEGLIFGIAMSLKIIAIITSVPIMTMTTPTQKLIVALSKMRIPYSLIFILTTAMRFTPLIMATYSEIIEAQKIRGHDIDKMNLITRLRKAYIPIVTPLFISLLRSADELQISIESRAFGAVKKRSYVEEVKIRAVDALAIGVMAFLMFAMIYGVILWGTAIPQANPIPPWLPVPDWLREIAQWFVFPLPDWAKPP